jgi:hypothetical protein
LAKLAGNSKAQVIDRSLLLAFAASLLGYGVSMVSGAMTQVFPIMTGFWFVFCLGWRFVEISTNEVKKVND